MGGVDSEQETPLAIMCSWLFTKQATNYKMVKTQHNSVNVMTFQTQSQSVDRDIKSCPSAGNS